MPQFINAILYQIEVVHKLIASMVSCSYNELKYANIKKNIPCVMYSDETILLYANNLESN